MLYPPFQNYVFYVGTRVRLFASAAAAPENLLVTRKGTEGFEFDRTVSRLIEIRSTEYLADHKARYTEDVTKA